MTERYYNGLTRDEVIAVREGLEAWLLVSYARYNPPLIWRVLIEDRHGEALGFGSNLGHRRLPRYWGTP